MSEAIGSSEEDASHGDEVCAACVVRHDAVHVQRHARLYMHIEVGRKIVAELDSDISHRAGTRATSVAEADTAADGSDDVETTGGIAVHQRSDVQKIVDIDRAEIDTVAAERREYEVISYSETETRHEREPASYRAPDGAIDAVGPGAVDGAAADGRSACEADEVAVLPYTASDSEAWPLYVPRR